MYKELAIISVIIAGVLWAAIFAMMQRYGYRIRLLVQRPEDELKKIHKFINKVDKVKK